MELCSLSNWSINQLIQKQTSNVAKALNSHDQLSKRPYFDKIQATNSEELIFVYTVDDNSSGELYYQSYRLLPSKHHYIQAIAYIEVITTYSYSQRLPFSPFGILLNLCVKSYNKLI